jgi:hypothetical protein
MPCIFPFSKIRLVLKMILLLCQSIGTARDVAAAGRRGHLVYQTSLRGLDLQR